MRKIFLLVALLAGMLSSCGDEEITRDPSNIGQLYYPLEMGRFYVFNVTERTYANNALTETLSYQTREEINAVSKDQTGRDWYRVQVSKRTTENDSWIVTGTRLISVSASNLQIQENNKTTVHMVFPVKEGYGYVANGFTNKEDVVYYTYKDLEKAFTTNGNSFDNTLTIVKANEDTELGLDQWIEVLAQGTGPVFRSRTFRQYCDGSAEIICEIGDDFIITGFDKEEELVSHGKL